MSLRSGHQRLFTPFPYHKGDVFSEGMSPTDINNLFVEILDNGIHGFCFSVYQENQKPGSDISDQQIIHRLNILKPHSQWIRTFSTTEGNDKIPQLAKEMGFKTLVGAWLGQDLDKNELEIQNLISLAKDNLVDIAAVGNEVLYRDDLPKSILIDYIKRVKNELPHLPIGYVDSYYEFSYHPDLVDVCDVILANFYPFWEGTHFDDTLQHLHYMYNVAREAAGQKSIIITETGWPSQGNNVKASKPSLINALKYFIQSQLWAIDNNIDLFYFSSFDEAWKVASEGDVGAYWGIWDAHEKLKLLKT